jgi:hypothetical protein
MYRQSIEFPVKDAALREDVRALGESIGEMLREQGGDGFFELVEGDRVAAIDGREGESVSDGDLLARTAGRAPAAATDLIRAFSIWFQAVNTAEKVHRVRRRREYLSDATTAQPGGIAACITRCGATACHWPTSHEPDRIDEHRAGLHRASDRIDAPHDAAQAAAYRPGFARSPQSGLTGES